MNLGDGRKENGGAWLVVSSACHAGVRNCCIVEIVMVGCFILGRLD